ncbi:phosphoenolpyruvate carboxykinase (GTP) [Treponema primitia]|uniref:phosphoenolpyruvate carboxykinase (GTP) n=1 Tax=Treponema primitia TaxID=88058 RepID=UPI00398097F9
MKVQELKHAGLKKWIEDAVALMTPDSVEVCEGTQTEYNHMIMVNIAAGLATPLNAGKLPGCVLFRSDPSDVARVEDRTFISSEKESDAGPTNHWTAPAELKKTMTKLYKGSMKGRTMYVIPFSMGPVGSDIAKIGVEITDSAYVVANMHIMTRVGVKVLDVLGKDGFFVPCYHSVGKPLAEGEKDNGVWPCAPMADKYISHFPETREIWSYGSGYGGNALLGKKCLALRIASVLARDEGWLAEHMLILKLTNPKGDVKYVTGAFPSACGKTNLAMLIPTLPGWKVETVGDDIAWMKFGADGRLYAINPEAGFFGVAPGTNYDSNKNAMESCKKNSIFTNCGLTEDGDIWWEQIGQGAAGQEVIDWKGALRPSPINDKPVKGQEIAHPNARFTAPAKQCPCVAPEWEDPKGVPISAFLFGGRRPSTIPLVNQAKSWTHGVFMGSITGSEVTAAVISDQVGQVRRDPFAMLPFCGYHMGDYFKHWLSLGKKAEAAGKADKLPKIFFVNWFRKDADGKFMWPGYGENSRVLAWVFDRCDNKDNCVETPIGNLPKPGTIEAPKGVSEAVLKELCSVDIEGWKKEIADVRKNHYPKFGDKMPKELYDELDAIEKRLNA